MLKIISVIYIQIFYDFFFCTYQEVVPDSKLYLIDRPVRKTMSRAIAALGPWLRLKLAYKLLFVDDVIT